MPFYNDFLIMTERWNWSMLCKESHHFKSEKSLNKNSYLVKLHSFNWTGWIELVCFHIPVLCSRNHLFFHKTWLNFVLSVFLYAFGGKEIILVLESNLVFVYMQEPEKSDFHLHRFNANAFRHTLCAGLDYIIKPCIRANEIFSRQFRELHCIKPMNRAKSAFAFILNCEMNK